MDLRSFGTHDGTFHADEVTACALLLLFDKIDRSKIVRSRDLKRLEQCEYVCDVGGLFDSAKKRFDHHQIDYTGGMSSAGMVWEHLLLTGVVDERLYDYFNRALVFGVDAHDNGCAIVEPGICTFSQVISNFVPVVYDVPAEELSKAFFEALDFTEGHVRRLLERYCYIEECRHIVEEAMKKREKYLFFEKALPWMDVFFDLKGEEHPALFIIMPSGRHWKLRGIPPTSQDRWKVRMPLPESWAGLMEHDLKKASGIPGAIFCHKGRFISVWETKEDALRALKEVLRKDA